MHWCGTWILNLLHLKEWGTFINIQQALFKEFKKPKLEYQCIIEIKEIKQQQGESVWDFD